MELIEKQLIKPIPDGGAPVFANDLLQVQENAKNSLNSFMNAIARLSSDITQVDVNQNIIKSMPAGLFVTNPIYSNSGSGTSTAVSECYVYLDGEIMYFSGGNFNLQNGGTGGNLQILTKGNALKTPRVFKDGSTKEILVTHEVTATLSSYGGAVGTIFIPDELDGKQGVYLSSLYFGIEEKQPFSLKNALGISTLETKVSNIENSISKTVHNVSTLTNGTQVDQLRFTRNGDGLVIAEGSLTLSNVSDADTLFTLPSGYFRTGRTFKFAIAYEDATTTGWYVELQGNGIVVIKKSANAGGGNFTGGVSFDGISYLY